MSGGIKIVFDIVGKDFTLGRVSGTVGAWYLLTVAISPAYSESVPVSRNTTGFGIGDYRGPDGEAIVGVCTIWIYKLDSDFTSPVMGGKQ
jgi:hypothetical protein